MSVGKSRSLSSLVKLAFTGAVTGTLLSVSGCFWLIEWHEEDDFEWCDDVYAECLRDAGSDRERQFCEDDVRYCYESCEGGWDDDGRGDYGDGDDGNDDGNSDDGGSSSDDGSDDSGSSDDGGDPDVCIELFSNCIDAAQTLEDVDACEALYDQCTNPGECPTPGCGCPADELAACLDHYDECAALADTPEKVELCASGFDTCTAPFADECAVDENPNLEPCLDQHELCVACADGDEQLVACQDVFDTCMLAG